MRNRLLHSSAIRIAIACCFALALVPRATVYEHEHVGTTPGHVHAWDGARLDSVRELIDEARGGHDHDHPHPHPHPHDLAGTHGDAGDHARAARSSVRKDGARGPAYAATTGSTQRHAHTQAPFQSVARSLVVPLPPARTQTSTAPAGDVRPVARTSSTLRARSPPLSAQA